MLFYGDDFTGASDNAAQYARHGLATVLFFADPGAAALAQASRDYDVVGVAGTARSLPTTRMRDELQPVFTHFKALGVPLVQYKCCSTFDSSPDIGSLGEAVRQMRAHWPQAFVPVLAATPEFGRYTLFGDHYARAGQQVYRLDRHPVMAHHPVTPMQEASLARVLDAQGFAVTRQVDLRELDAHEAAPEVLAAALAAGDSAVFDGYAQAQVMTAAAALWQLSQTRGVCAIAAQGFAHALGQWQRAQGLIAAPAPQHALAPVKQLLVLSGSCSALSAQQIDWAERAGFVTLRIPVEVLLAEALSPALAPLAQAMQRALAAGNSVLLYTARGPEDPMIAAVRAQVPPLGADAVAARIGEAFGHLARLAFTESALQRLVVAGGDSSSYAMRALGATALTMCASHFGQNAHVGRLLAHDARIAGKEVLLKGGQVGAADLYGLMLAGF